MSKSEKDSAEVVEFMTLFNRLKYWCDDAPKELADLAATDTSVKDLCNRLYAVAQNLRRVETSEPASFIAPVTPDFVDAWRDYEQRYEHTLFEIECRDADTRFIDIPPGYFDSDLRWQAANVIGAEYEVNIRAMVLAAEILADKANLVLSRLPNGNSDEDPPTIQKGLEDWKRLTETVGLDLRGVLRRRQLVPFVMIPRHVGKKYGSAERLSMFRNLEQAHCAFVFGATHAALGLMRSIMESVLRDHYRAEGKDLNERIRNARSRLPPGANEAALHRLRKLANAILHLDREKDEGLPITDDVQLEKETVSLLFVLRDLIEGAK